VTKIYIYCLFDKDDSFRGVYSSLSAAHRDALKICNQGTSQVYVEIGGSKAVPTLRLLKSIFKGETDIKIKYFSNLATSHIIKTKLKE
jgi:hypothetical protein